MAPSAGLVTKKGSVPAFDQAGALVLPVRSVIEHVAVPGDGGAALEIFHAIEINRYGDRHLLVQPPACIEIEQVRRSRCRRIGRHRVSSHRRQ